MKKKRIQKNLFIINREFQLKYLRYAVGVGFLSTLVTAFVILYPLYVFQILRIPRFLPTPFLIAMVAGIILNISLLAFVSLLITHRIVGPLFAIGRSFHDVERGKWNARVHLRTTDELHYVARGFNSMAEGMCNQIKHDIALCQEIQQNISKENWQEGKKLAENLERNLVARISDETDEDIKEAKT